MEHVPPETPQTLNPDGEVELLPLRHLFAQLRRQELVGAPAGCARVREPRVTWHEWSLVERCDDGWSFCFVGKAGVEHRIEYDTTVFVHESIV